MLDYGALGQEASIALRTVSRSAAPETQSVIPFQKEPAPTAPGIWSDASKRTVVAWETISAAFFSTGSPYQLGSTSFCIPIAPPCPNHHLTPSPVEMYCKTAAVSGLSFVAAKMSPATSTGLPYCGSTGGR